MTLLVPCEPCDRCPATPGLLVRTRVGRICVTCWLALPEKMRWLPPATMQETHEAEVRARERMMARGGADAHIVRKGLS